MPTIAKAVELPGIDAWERWRGDDGVSKTAFGKALKRLGYDSPKSNGQTLWLGITIRKS